MTPAYLVPFVPRLYQHGSQQAIWLWEALWCSLEAEHGFCSRGSRGARISSPFPDLTLVSISAWQARFGTPVSIGTSPMDLPEKHRTAGLKELTLLQLIRCTYEVLGLRLRTDAAGGVYRHYLLDEANQPSLLTSDAPELAERAHLVNVQKALFREEAPQQDGAERKVSPTWCALNPADDRQIEFLVRAADRATFIERCLSPLALGPLHGAADRTLPMPIYAWFCWQHAADPESVRVPPAELAAMFSAWYRQIHPDTGRPGRVCSVGNIVGALRALERQGYLNLGTQARPLCVDLPGRFDLAPLDALVGLDEAFRPLYRLAHDPRVGWESDDLAAVVATCRTLLRAGEPATAIVQHLTGYNTKAERRLLKNQAELRKALRRARQPHELAARGEISLDAAHEHAVTLHLPMSIQTLLPVAARLRLEVATTQATSKQVVRIFGYTSADAAASVPLGDVRGGLAGALPAGAWLQHCAAADPDAAVVRLTVHANSACTITALRLVLLPVPLT